MRGVANGANERRQNLEDVGLSGKKSGHWRCVLGVGTGHWLLLVCLLLLAAI